MFWLLLSQDLQSISKKPPVVKAKRAPKVGGGVPNSRKKSKKDETGKSTEALMKQLKQVGGEDEATGTQRMERNVHLLKANSVLHITGCSSACSEKPIL